MAMGARSDGGHDSDGGDGGGRPVMAEVVPPASTSPCRQESPDNLRHEALEISPNLVRYLFNAAPVLSAIWTDGGHSGGAKWRFFELIV